MGLNDLQGLRAFEREEVSVTLKTQSLSIIWRFVDVPTALVGKSV
jgi:hypothetical protein